MLISPLRFVDAAISHVGCVRSHNEDNFVARPESGLWCVADGMGGHVNGRRAADLIVEKISAVRLPGSFDADVLETAQAIHEANSAIWRESQDGGYSMGSTAAALVIRDRRFAVLWAGDSRAYLLRHGQLHRLTTDHTQVQELLDRGLLTPEEAKGHPMSHMLSRAVGVRPDLELDAVSDEVEEGDIFILCSDGLYGVLKDDQIIAPFSTERPQRACDQLVDVCLKEGAPDNVTIIAVACELGTFSVFSPASDG